MRPADRKLYALRDVTGTVESIPLIASSIMSKKIAEGTSALVLDVKVGSGAFMKDVGQARELARTMVELGRAHGVTTVALLTDMSTPLGRAVGNAVEVEESLEVLAGGGPADVVELTLALAREMLAAAGLSDVDPAEVLASGAAMDSWRAMIRAQGGDPMAPLAVAKETELIRATESGYVESVDAMGIGLAAWRLGAGRARKEDPVSVGAGVVLHKRPGDRVTAGDVLAELRADDAGRIPAALPAAADAIVVARAAGSDAASSSSIGLDDRIVHASARSGSLRRARRKPCRNWPGSGLQCRRRPSRWSGTPVTWSSCGPPSTWKGARRSCT